MLYTVKLTYLNILFSTLYGNILQVHGIDLAKALCTANLLHLFKKDVLNYIEILIHCEIIKYTENRNN